MLAKLLDGITSTTDGEWIDIEGVIGKTLHIKGIGTATLKVCGSMDMTKPFNSNHEIQIGADITADCLLEIAAHLRWIKVRCSSYSSGTIYAFMGGQISAIYG